MAKPKLPYSVRLKIRPSQQDPTIAKVQVTLRLSDGRRFSYTSKGYVKSWIAEKEFSTDGRPWDCERYDKKTYTILRGLYVCMMDAAVDNIYVDGTPVACITRDMIKKDFTDNLADWSKKHGGVEI